MVLVLENSVEVCVHTDSIREHFFLVIKKRVGAEILCEIDTLVHHHSSSSASIAAASTLSLLVAPHKIDILLARCTPFFWECIFRATSLYKRRPRYYVLGLLVPPDFFKEKRKQWLRLPSCCHGKGF